MPQADTAVTLGAVRVASDMTITFVPPPMLRATGNLCVMRRPQVERLMRRPPPARQT